ncbi:hypothetical protein Tco_1148021, partial [Tanacetum coccineum]
LVPSCFAIFDLEPLTLSLDFVLMYEIFKSLSFRLDRLCRLAILCLDQHAHTLHHLESLLTISLDRLDILKEDLFEHEHVVVNPTPAGMRHHHLHLYMNPEIKQLAIKRVDEYGFVIRPDLVRLTSGSTASTPIETQKPLVKDEEASDVDVTPKTSHLSVVKRIFRYLKGKPKVGLWYPKVSSFDLEAYSDSDYAGANLDRKSTTGGYQFLCRRLIYWQCKKQTIVANSTTEAEIIVAAASLQVLWIQNQMLDYGFNFMNTKIYIDNKSTICIVKNPVYHSKTKHIAIRHHFIRDAYKKKLIQVLKIHTDDNVADLLTKAFDVSRF